MPKSGQSNNKRNFTNNNNRDPIQSFQGYNKIIIICIDRDDDIAIKDPEDSDCNAIFGAIKSYEEFKTKGHDVEVTLVAGRFNRGIEGDAKIAQEIDTVLDKYN